MPLDSNQKIYKYFSQHGEDFLLWNFFNFKKKGFYIEVGAFDGIYLSNSYSFEQHGWRGICIEPSPEYYKLCVKNRPLAINLNVACVENDSTNKVLFNSEESGLLSSVSNTQEYHADLKSRYAENNLHFHSPKKIQVPAATLNNLLQKHTEDKIPIDFLSIDVEGYEENVLKGFDINKYSPQVLLIEANTSLDEDKIISLMDSKSYLFARKLGVNLIFVKNKRDQSKIQNIKMNCFIEKQHHPIDWAHSIPSIVKGLMFNETKADNMQAMYNKNTTLNKENHKLTWEVDALRHKVKSLAHERFWLSSSLYFTKKNYTLIQQIQEYQKIYDKYIVYGAGSIANIIYQMSPKSVIAFIDLNPNNSLIKTQVPIVTPVHISDIETLPILISVLGREKGIIKDLMNNFNISSNRLITFLNTEEH